MIKLYSWNVNGIRAVLRKGALQEFITKHDPDILCLQETKAQQDQAETDFPQYTEYWCSAVKKGYSGTAIFTKQKPLQVLNGFPESIVKKFKLVGDKYGNPNDEGRVMAAEFKDFWVVTVYTPNSKNDLSRLSLRYDFWDLAFLAYVQELEKTKPVAFCGDLNVAHKEIDLANPDANRGKHGFTDEERQRFNEFLDAGYVDTFRSLYPDKTAAYSWWTAWANARARNVGWRIDYWMISPKLQPALKDAAIHADVMGSDHCPVSITLDI